MTEVYQINGVTITPKGGSVFELSHPKLAAPEIVRGKEKADTRAEDLGNELAGDASDEEAPMDAQPLVPPVPENAAAVVDAPVSRAEFDALMVKLGQLSQQISDAPTVTVTAPEDEVMTGRTPSGLPRRYTGRMTPATRALLEKYGMGIKTIVLEENSDIPPTGLFVSHNGTGYMIQPGIECDVPEFLLNILDNAQTSTPIVDQQTQKVLGYRSRTKYPYRVINAASD